MNDFKVTGQCLCGAVSYVVTAPAKSLEHCHCSMCRRAHGTLSAAGAVVEAARFRIERGASTLRSYTSSPGNHRWFCGGCGCQIYMTVDHVSDEIYYWPASLDDGMHPGHSDERECHIFVGSRAPWDRFDEGLPEHETTAADIGLGLT